MKVPKRKYYPLSEAAEMLGCSVNDLIFHGAHGSVELCAYMQTEMDIKYNDDSLKWEVTDAYYCNDDKIPTSYPEIMIGPDSGSTTIDGIIKTKGEYNYIYSSDILLVSDSGYGLKPAPIPTGDYVHGFRYIKVKGLMAVPQFILKDFETILMNGDDVECVFWDVPKSAIANSAECNPINFTPEIAGWEHSISKKNLYITLTEMDKLVASDSGNFLTYKQALFIYDLLAIHYGEDVAENPRGFIDNPDSEIAKDFNKKGKNLPSGRSVERWLKKVF
ncbi:hypothetical protein LGS79_002131 [Salmonella enterica]|nr:hypothetical protein [Salmonella enterica]